MPSRRMIDPAFWQSENVASLSIPTRFFFIGLFSNADDQGRMKAHPALVRSKLYPYDDIQIEEIEGWLQTLIDGEYIIVYEYDGKTYLQIINWWKYQRPRWAWPSEHPGPDRWIDRVHYRQGNSVITDNWDDFDSDPTIVQDDDESTVEPPRDHDEAAEEPAPSGSTSGSTRTSKDTPTESGKPDLPTSFEEWHSLVEQSKNRSATLHFMFETLYPGRSPPSYGYIGKTARGVGGAGRLAELLWMHSTKPPTGDVLAYILASVKKGRDNGKHSQRGRTDEVRLADGSKPRAAKPEDFYTAEELAALDAG